MVKNYSYIPNKENLLILFKDEYKDIIKHLKKNKEVQYFDRIIKETFDAVCLNLFLENHYCKAEEICSEAGDKEYKDVEKIVCDRLNINPKIISLSDISYSIVLKREFQKIINVVNNSVIPQKVIDLFKSLMVKATFIKFEYIKSEEYSYLYFLDSDFEIISTITISSSYAKHITAIYNNKDHL